MYYTEHGNVLDIWNIMLKYQYLDNVGRSFKESL